MSGNSSDFTSFTELSIDSLKRIEAAEEDAKRKLWDELRKYTPANPKWLRTRENELEGFYRAISHISVFCRSVFDAHATEYERCTIVSPSEVTFFDRIVSFVRAQTEAMWTVLLVSYAVRLAPRTLGVEKGAAPADLEPAPSITPSETIHQARYRKIEASFREHIEVVLSERRSHWQQRIERSFEEGNVRSADLPRRNQERLSGDRREFVEPILAEKGWSLADWAVESGVDFHTVNDFLKGITKPYPSTRKKIAGSLGRRPEDLPR